MARTFLGGQAVLEGVLMIFKDVYAIAVRTTNGIHVHTSKPWVLRSKLLTAPFLRGPVALLAMLFIGTKAMLHASQHSSDDDEELGTGALVATVALSLSLAFVLFKLAPLLVTTQAVSTSQPVLFNLVDGLLRIAAFVGYLWLISHLDDIKRLFEYHGAEHKAINAYERGELSLASARSQSRFHPRCGTTFIVIVLVAAILIYSLTPINLPLGQLLALRVLLLLPIASLSYELIRIAGSHHQHPVMRVVLAPGYWLQRLTVNEPNDEQLEVAIRAIHAVQKAAS